MTNSSRIAIPDPVSGTRKQQETTLNRLIRYAARTSFGSNHAFSEILNYAQFKNNVPVCSYQELRPFIDALKGGSRDLLWPGTVSKFAVSSGTTGRGKHLPLSADRLRSDKHFMRMTALSYLKQRPNILKLLGHHLSLPGSLESSGSHSLGEISGFTALQAPFWLKPFQLISPHKLTELPFKEKFDLVLDKSLNANIKVIMAVPSWILTLFQRALQRTRKKSIAQVWPNLSLLVCGGVKLANYRPHLEELCGNIHPDFIETYGASEGYFAYSDFVEHLDLKLVIDNGIFYEFIPHPLPDEDALGIQDTIPLWKVNTGIPYAMLVSTNAGLWRYTVRDIVEFTSVDPPRLIVRGRISEMLDDFGEALYLLEAEEALKKATDEIGEQIGTFTIQPEYPEAFELPRHRWFVQFYKPVHPQTLEKIAKRVDDYLKQVNRHYAIRRESRALDMPKLKYMTQNDINRWLQAHEKVNAQGKLPRVLPADADFLP